MPNEKSEFLDHEDARYFYSEQYIPVGKPTSTRAKSQAKVVVCYVNVTYSEVFI